MSNVFIRRAVYFLDMPLQANVEVLHAELVIVRIGEARTLDFGSLCFTSRDLKTGRSRDAQGYLVDLTSKVPRRAKSITRIIDGISDEIRNGASCHTVGARYGAFFTFMNWVDSSGYQIELSNENSCRQVLMEYVGFLRDRVRRNNIKNNYAAGLQHSVIAVLELTTGNENLSRGLYLIRACGRASCPTIPPDEFAQGMVIDLCTSVFNGVCDLLLNKRPYPYAVEVHERIGLKNNLLWIFPSNQWFKTPAMLEDRRNRWSPAWGFDYECGNVASVESLEALGVFNSQKKRIEAVERARKSIKASNEDFRHSRRREIGGVALNCFAILFVAQTGMNWAQVRNLAWSDDYSAKSANQGFRTIKCRANGKLVSFELPAKFMPSFRKYLELRKFILHEIKEERLFFRERCEKITKISSDTTSMYVTLTRIYPSLPRVLPRMWRAAKSDWLLRKTDPATTALVLQNTEKTVLKSYAEGSVNQAALEITAFLDGVSSVVLDKQEVVENSTKRSIGLCKDFNNPVPEKNPAVQPNCRGAEGCLFCKQFKVHADDIDIRKLLSCRYCIQQTTSAMSMESRFKKLMQPVIRRINLLLDEISRRDSSIVSRITNEVYEEGELDPYWAKKLEMLLELGVVT